MNKKFLSAILFGALMVTSTGTFVSCKDYDDDIEDLQEQINKLATKEDMASQIATLQSALTNAAKDASDAISKATAAEAAAKAAGDTAAEAKAAADKAAAEAKAAAIEAAKAEVAATKASLEKLVADGLAENKGELDKMAKKVEEATKKVEEIVGKIADMVTSVELVDSYSADNGQFDEAKAVLDILTVTQQKNDGFGPNGEIKTVKDVQYNFGGKLIVRVSPTNAELKADMISLINSNGDDLNKFITIGTPKRYDGDLLTRAAATGLWEVSYNWKQYNANELAAVAKNNGKDVLYAVAINNTAASMEVERNVVSSFDLSIKEGSFKQANALYFTAGGKKVADLKNRWDGSAATDNASKDSKEYKWSSTAAVKPATENTALDNNDNRSTKDYLSVKVGVPFDIKLDGKLYGEEGLTAPWRFYVTLDEDFAEANSEPSEINAWNTYAKKTTGLNVLDENGKVSISINDETAEGDIIGFRVYAVNFDGTLVDPDGRAFYVYVGTPGVSAADLTLITEIKAPYAWDKFVSSEKKAFSTSDWSRANGGTYEITYTDPTKSGSNKTISATELGLTYANFLFKDKNGNPYSLFNADGSLANNATQAVSVEMTNIDPSKLKDGVKYTATIIAKNKTTKAVVATATITFTKQLPAFPSAIVYPYTEVLMNNVLHVYPIASEDKNSGTFDMRNVWHGIALESKDADWNAEWNNASSVNKGDAVTFNQVLTDAQQELVDKKQYPTITYTAADRIVTVDAKLVDPNNNNKPFSAYYLNEFPMTVNYNYGSISLPFNKQTNAWATSATSWNPTGTEFKIVLRNYADDCEISWNGDAPTLYYPGAAEQKDSIALSKIIVKDWYKNNVDLSKDNDYFKAQKVKVSLLTGANDATIDEYYSAEIIPATTYGKGDDAKNVPAQIRFTSKVNKSQGNPVATKLKVTITDNFGYTVSETIAPFTMSFQKK